MNQMDIWAAIAQTALNYIFVSVLTSNSQKATVTDLKTDLRTTKEDLLSELKDSRESLLQQQETTTNAIIEIVKKEIKQQQDTTGRG